MGVQGAGSPGGRQVEAVCREGRKSTALSPPCPGQKAPPTRANRRPATTGPGGPVARHDAAWGGRALEMVRADPRSRLSQITNLSEFPHQGYFKSHPEGLRR